MPTPNWGRKMNRRQSGGAPSSSPQQQHQLVPPSATSPWFQADVSASQSPSLSFTASNIIPQHPHQHQTSIGSLLFPSSAPSCGTSSGGLGSLRRAREKEEDEQDSNAINASRFTHPGLIERSSSLPLLKRSRSNPFLQKPLHVSRESSPLLLGSHPPQQFGSMLSMQSNLLSDQGDVLLAKKLHSPPVSTQHGHVERHLTLIDLIAVGVGGTLGTGFFLLCSLLTSSYAGPASIFCWLVSAVPALISGFCFAELAGQIPAAGSTYAYVYASMGELPAVIAAGCLSLEYLVSAGAVARGWGDTMVEWIPRRLNVD